MKKTELLTIAVMALISCKQSIKSTLETVETETVNSERKYEYVNAMGKRLIIQNSVPKGGGYMSSDGQRHPYVVFYTQVTNETNNPIQFTIDFPSVSLEFPFSSGNYMELFVPSDTMTPGKVPLIDYGFPVKRYLETNIPRSHSLKRTIIPKESTAFYVVMRSNKGINGTIRTGLRLKGFNLVYRISAFKSTPEHPLMDEKEITCGGIDLKDFVLKK